LGRIRFGRFQSGVQKFENGPRLGETLLSRRSRNRPGTDHPDYPQNPFQRMNERKPKIIKKETRRLNDEEIRRTEVAMLKLLASKYPDIALKTEHNKAKQILIDND
jgi:hypothetical protein